MKEKNTSSSKPIISKIMNYIDLQLEKIKFGLDWPLFLSTLALIIIGLVMVFSATTSIGVNGEVTDPVGHFQTQLISVTLGIIVGLAMFFIPRQVFRDFKTIMYGLVIILLFLIYVFFFGIEAGGAKSWMAIGSISFQPSEFLKTSYYICCLLDFSSNRTNSKFNQR